MQSVESDIDAMRPLADSIARCVLRVYDKLPNKCKARTLDNGRREWTIIAGIVLSRTANAQTSQIRCNGEPSEEALNCVALATGMKCLPRSKVLVANGNALHDWHAEVLCMRAFNRWLVDECQLLVERGASQWLSRQSGPPFRLEEGVDIHMYVSAAPCGDASMELIMAAQQDATPWTKPAPSSDPNEMLGRGHFDQLGAVRKKPARPDAPATWSKSCSDKLAAKQCTSLLSSITQSLIDPSSCYLKTLVLPCSELVDAAVDRCFRTRLSAIAQADVQAKWQKSGHVFSPFTVLSTDELFCHARTDGSVSSVLASLWTPRRQEVLANGILQGRKQNDPRGASCASKRRMAEDVLKLRQDLRLTDDGLDLTYRELKAACEGGSRTVKEDLRALALTPWKVNDGDDGWRVSSGASEV